VNVAYQVVGEAALDLVMVPGFVSHVELAWEEPTFARFLTRLASFSRLIVFDKRGTGMSDPVTAGVSALLRDWGGCQSHRCRLSTPGEEI
jgi:pimeloyl-ACP methyl ester carboxylesterase